MKKIDTADVLEKKDDISFKISNVVYSLVSRDLYVSMHSVLAIPTTWNAFVIIDAEFGGEHENDSATEEI